MKLFTIILPFLFMESFSTPFLMQVKNSEELEKLESKTTSLVKLLLYIKQNYFEEHPIVVIYDSNFEKHQPIEFKRFLENFSSSFVQERFDFSFSEKSRARLRDKIYNYIIFVEKVDSIKHLMKPDSRSRIVLITADTSWTIRDFLKSQLSRFYAHLLILTQATSRRAGVSTFGFTTWNGRTLFSVDLLHRFLFILFFYIGMFSLLLDIKYLQNVKFQNWNIPRFILRNSGLKKTYVE